MKRFMLSLCCAVTSLMAAMGAPKAASTRTPDFAFPKQVSAQASKDLKAAFRSNDGKAILSAAIRLGLAESAVSSDSLPPVMKRLERVASDESDRATRSLLYTLLAKMYYQFYANDRSVYDERQLPLAPYPDDLRAWSGNQFRSKIKEFIGESLKGEDVLKSTRLADYTPVITADQTTLLFYPTLYDFVANEAISTYTSLDNNRRFQLSRKWADPADEFEKLPVKYLPREAAVIVSLYQKLAEMHRGETAPMVMTERNRLEWVTRYLPRTDVYDRPDTRLSLTRLWLDAYTANKENDYAGLLLEEAADAAENVAEKRQFVNAARDYISTHPTAFDIKRIRYLISRTTEPEISLQYPSITSPGFATPVRLSGQNVKECVLNVYSVGNNVTRYYGWDTKLRSNALLIESVTVAFPGEAPCSNDTTVTITLPRYGNYAIVPVVKGVTPRNEMVTTIGCTDLALTTLSADGLREAIVVNPVSGKPAAGAEIKWQSMDRGITQTLGTTDQKGILAITTGSNSMELKPIKGNDRYSRSVTAWTPYRMSEQLRAELVTDLPLYHPGDTIEAAAVVYSRRPDGSHPASGKDIKLTLFNANYIEIDSARMTTDEWGRAKYRFALPETGLTGQFTLRATIDHNLHIGDRSVMVSDYKLPTFEIIADKVDATPGSDVIVTGKAVTYSGFPLADTEVTLSLSNTMPWRWRGWGQPEPPFFTATAKTDSAGKFKFVLSQEILAGAPQPDYPFAVDLTAVSPSGESRSASVNFVNAKSYSIRVSVPSVIDATSPAEISADIVSWDGKETSYPVSAALVNKAGENVATLPIVKSREISLAAYPSGQYEIRFSPADTTVRCLPDSRPVTIYRPTDSSSPVESPLWVPQKSVMTAGQKRMAKVLYAAATDSTMVYYAAIGANGVASKGWLTPRKGMNTLEIAVPENEKTLRLKMIAISDLNRCEETVVVNTPESARGIEINVETFRDKVTPGGQEQLTLTVKDRDGNPVHAALMADMYNKALTQLAANTFSINPPTSYTPGISLNSAAGATHGIYVNGNTRYVAGITPRLPQFNLYNRNFAGRGIMIRGMAKASMGMAKMAYQVNAVDEMKEDVLEEEISNCALAAPMASADAGASAAGTDGSDESPEAAPQKNDEFAFRDAEIPLAFFRPMLTTDTEGRVEIIFTVPNANTTWLLSALAYDNEMLSSSTTREIIAAKPLMVQPNCPRFLRMGDKAVIISNIMNATDSAQNVTTVFELFDPATGNIISSDRSETKIEGGQSAIVKTEIETPYDIVMLGYRVKSSTDRFADGEQGIIPVLESVQPVIESQPFYMPADSTIFSTAVKPTPEGGRTTLQFCENPTWYVVTALPGLRAETGRTSLSASAAIYSAAVAEGIIRNNPEIKTALHRWTTSDRSDSALVSMLERNQDLKTVMLQATPWMLDARNDNERMERLALLFDRKETQSAYATNIETLAKMQCHGGGWSWIPEYKETSYWATLCILDEMGDLKALGYMPSDKRLESMIVNAVEYIDRETAARFRKYPKGDYTAYVAARDKFPDIKQSTAAARVTAATVQNLISGWKQLNVTDKALAAIILKNHSYSATARNIISSLDEYATSSPAMGMWWPSLDDLTYSRYSKIGAAAILLDAYRTVTPGNQAIDKIRQWIVMQKEAQDWRDGAITSQVISSFLNSGSKWTVPARGAVVEIDGKDVATTPIDKTTGYFRNDITRYLSNGGTLKVYKTAAYPSWGAVITQAKMVMADIKPSSCESVSIEKRYFREVRKPEGIEWEETDRYNVGDKVRIDLLIKADRDMDYVAITDQRSACFEPVEQLPMPIIAQGIYFYRENRDAVTNIFVDRLPKGVYRLSYEMNVNNAGRFASGVATLQSQYAPALTAHSGGKILKVTGHDGD